MYDHETDTISDSIGITKEKHYEIADEIEKIMIETDAVHNVSKAVEKIVNYMGSESNLDITKSVISHFLMNLFDARNNNPMAMLEKMIQDRD